MRVHHLDTATLCPRGAWLVNGHGSPFARARLVCHCLLVETPTRLVLVDTGLGRGDLADPQRLGRTWVRQVSPRLDPAGTAHARITALGRSPADVTDVIVTHLDLDHAGGLPDFPAARVHVHARERRAFEERLGTRAALRYVAAHVAHRPRWATFEDGGDTWHGFAGVRALADDDPDVLLVPLPGHTLGHTGVAVRTADGWLLHAGDGYFFHGQMAERPHAPWGLAFFQRRGDADRSARGANQERLRALAISDANVQVFCAHDPVELDRLSAS